MGYETKYAWVTIIGNILVVFHKEFEDGEFSLIKKLDLTTIWIVYNLDVTGRVNVCFPLYNDLQEDEPLVNKWLFSFGENACQLVLPSFKRRFKSHVTSNFAHNHLFLNYYDYKEKTHSYGVIEKSTQTQILHVNEIQTVPSFAILRFLNFLFNTKD